MKNETDYFGSYREVYIMTQSILCHQLLRIMSGHIILVTKFL